MWSFDPKRFPQKLHYLHLMLVLLLLLWSPPKERVSIYLDLYIRCKRKKWSRISHPKWVLFIGDFPPIKSRSFKKKRLQRIQSFYTGWWLNQPHLKKIWIVKLDHETPIFGVETWKHNYLKLHPPLNDPIHRPSSSIHPRWKISWPAPMPGRSLMPQQPHHQQNLASKRPGKPWGWWDDGMMGWKAIP